MREHAAKGLLMNSSDSVESLKVPGSASPPNADGFEWEGWPLERCDYDGEFDLAARRRMVEGGRALRRYLHRYRGQTGKFILEIGPFFNPLATRELIPDATIFYWENDPDVLCWLETKGYAHAIPCDLSEVDDPSFLAPTRARLRRLTEEDRNFDAIIVSQVFNYIDYRALLRVLPGILEPEGLLFVNNVVDYGLPAFFSEHRPESIEATLAAIERSGFHPVAHEIIPSSIPEKQKHPRLVAVARLRRSGGSDPTRAARAVTEAFSRYLSVEGGFLPSYVPLSTLPARLAHYTEALDLLPATYSRDLGGVRKWMDERFRDFDPDLLPEIATLNDREQHKLLVALSILAHTYRWDSVPAPRSAYETETLQLPAGIEKPFFFLTDLLDQPRCGTLWSTTISNWRMKGRRGGDGYRNDEVTMENLQIAHSWFPSPMHEQLERWVLIFTVMEARGAPVIRDLVALIEAAAREDVPASIDLFRSVSANLSRMMKVFHREIRFRNLDKNLWREWVQPTFIWGLESGSGERLEGASGLQLGAVQCVDIALGVEGESAMGKAVIESRKYMPKPHRLFLAALDGARNVVRDFVIRSRSDELERQYNDCIGIMARFRTSHQARGAAYIRGDDSPKTITSTGLSLSGEESAVQVFGEAMEERIRETTQSLL